MSNIITGLDIGSAQIKGVVAAQKKDGTFSIISAFKHPSAGFRKGVLVDPEDAVQVLRDLIIDLQKISKKAVENLFVNVNSEHIKVRNSRGIAAVAKIDREIQQEDVDRVIQAAAAVKILPNHITLHNIIREYFVDEVGDIQNPVGMTGSRLEVGTIIIEAFSPHVNILVKCLRQTGGAVNGLVFNSLASSQSVLSKKQKDLGVLLIDFGSGTTTIAIYDEGKLLHAKSFPIGSAFLTNDIAIGLKTSIDVSEKLKITHGYALAKDIARRDSINLAEFDKNNKNEISKRFLAEIIEIRLAELLELINNELKAFGRIQLPAGAVITGGGVKLAGMSDLVKQELKLPVQIGFPNLNSFEIMNPTHQETLDDPEFATAVGLVLLGFIQNGKRKGVKESIFNFLQNFKP